MKRTLLSTVLLALLATEATAQDSAGALGHGLGDVVYSILPPDLFLAAHAGEWALVDGRTLGGDSGLYTFLAEQGRLDLLGPETRLPDARGVFIRGMNVNRNVGNGDPGGDRPVGSYQRDAMVSHQHTYNFFEHSSGIGRDNKGAYTWNGNNQNANGDRVHQTNWTGEAETRPRNTALYTYIKIGN